MYNDILAGMQTEIAVKIRDYLKRTNSRKDDIGLKNLAKDSGVAYKNIYQMWTGDYIGDIKNIAKIYSIINKNGVKYV